MDVSIFFSYFSTPPAFIKQRNGVELGVHWNVKLGPFNVQTLSLLSSFKELRIYLFKPAGLGAAGSWDFLDSK